MKYILPSDRSQYQIMSSLDELVSSDHPVRIIDQIVNLIVSSNKDRFEQENKHESGRPSYHASTHLKLYLYGYFNGISSSRKLEVETHRNTELIWLLGNLKPDHWTISNYRKENGEDIKFVTKKFREFLRDNGYIKLKTVAIDGTKVKAYTNRDMLTKEKIEIKLSGIDKKIEEYLTKISENDRLDDVKDEMENESIENGNEKYLTKIIELQKQVEQLQAQKQRLEKEGRNYISHADMDANLMKSRDGMIPAYNVQVAVDAENKMIVDSEVVTSVTDLAELPKMIESIKEELGQVPEEIIADKGYSTPDLIEQIEQREPGIEIFVAQEITSRDKEEIKFIYDGEKDEYLCSEGKRLVLKAKKIRKNKTPANIYRGIDCDGCPLKNQCTSSKKGRQVQRYINQKWRDDNKAKMQSDTGKQKMSLRKLLSEHPFGTIKYLMGKIPLLLRGVIKVGTEINLYTTVYNLKRLFNMESFENLQDLIGNYKWETA